MWWLAFGQQHEERPARARFKQGRPAEKSAHKVALQGHVAERCGPTHCRACFLHDKRMEAGPRKSQCRASVFGGRTNIGWDDQAGI